MTAGCGGGVGIGSEESMGDRVGLSGEGSDGVSDRNGIRVCVRNVFTEEEDECVGEWGRRASNTMMR